MRFGRLPGVPLGVQWCLEADNGGGGSGSGGGGNNNSDDDKARRNLENLLAQKNGDAIALSAQLLAENAGLRDDKRGLNKQITELKAKVPAEDAVVLSGDDLKAYNDLKALGNLDELKQLKTERDDFKTKYETEQKTNARNAREMLLRDVADNVAPGDKWKFSVLRDRDALTPGLSYEIKDVEENGQKAKRTFVKYKDGEGDSAPVKELALSDFASQKWSDYLPALQLGASANGGQNGGARHVAQGSGGSNGKGSIFDSIRKEAEEKNKAAKPDGPSVEERMNMR